MKIVHPELEYQIVLEENKVQIVVIEHPALFYRYVGAFQTQCGGTEIDGQFVLSEDGRELSFEKNAFLILNPFEMDMNNRKIIGKLYSEINEIVYEEEIYLNTNKIETEIELYLDKIAESVDYALEYDRELDIAGFLKSMNVKIQKDYETVLEKILDYLEIMQKLLKKKICIFVNLKSYLEEEDFKHLYEMINYRKLHLILIESHVPEKILEEEKIYIIDKNYCEIY